MIQVERREELQFIAAAPFLFFELIPDEASYDHFMNRSFKI